MKITRHLFGLALGIAAFAGLVLPAQANITVMCAPEVSVGSTGPRTIGGSTSAVPSGTLYSLNGQGCGLIQAADVGYFLSQGYTYGTQGGAIVFNAGVLPANVAGQAAAVTGGIPLLGTLPASSVIRDIIIQNTGGAVTGGIDFATVGTGIGVGATAIASNVTCAAGCLISLMKNPGMAGYLSTSVFSQATNIYASAVTNWNSANIIFTILWDYF